MVRLSTSSLRWSIKMREYSTSGAFHFLLPPPTGSFFIHSTNSTRRTIYHNTKQLTKYHDIQEMGRSVSKASPQLEGLAKSFQLETGLAGPQTSPPSTPRSLNTSLVTRPARGALEDPSYPDPRAGRQRPKSGRNP